jgi:hypothetical protein
VVERFLLAFLARARGSRGGTLLIIMGVVVLFAFLIFELVAVAGNAVLMITQAGPVMEFLATGPGVLAGFAVSVFIILLGVAFLNRATPHPTSSVSVIQQTGTSQTEKDREVELLQKKLSRAEQERDRYHAILADPTAKKRREERILRDRSFELGQEVDHFTSNPDLRRADARHVVDRFRRRHYDKVAELREDLKQREWLTEEEREILTLREHDSPDKIAVMARVLLSIGAGQ